MPEMSLGGGSGNALSTVVSARECNVSRRAALAQHFPLFNNAGLADCREIVSVARECQFSRRQIIFLQGDLVRNVILLTSGNAKITQLGQNGAEVIVHVVGRGELIGMIRFCGQYTHCSTAQALSDSTAFVWETEVFKALVVRFPVLGRNIANMISQQLQELEERYHEICTENVATRLSHQLVRLFNQVGRRTNGSIEINFSREELAQLSGTTLFTVSRLLSEWKERGVLSAGRECVYVHNIQALRDFAENE